MKPWGGFLCSSTVSNYSLTSTSDWYRNSRGLQRIPLHTSPRLAKLPGVAGALDKDGYLLQAQP